MNIIDFCNGLQCDFYTGVPDSLLSPLSNYLMDKYGVSEHHAIAVNEGNCVGLAAGYYLATGKTPVVYMQNSGIGNAVNPIASLLHEKVYQIPCIFVIGWRGEPGVHDEPQHVFQGEATLSLLEVLEIPHYVISADTMEAEYQQMVSEARHHLAEKQSVAFVVKKGALTYEKKPDYGNAYTLNRESAIKEIVNYIGEDIVVSTTGKISRELFEIREDRGESHGQDFLTVGSMGHASSIALGIALQKPEKRVWCIDGDGAALMHMGSMAVVGEYAPKNMLHIVLNNEAHETVGGLPTAAGHIDLCSIAKSCGYPVAFCINSLSELQEILQHIQKLETLVFLEVKVALGSRKDLGRPTTSAQENKQAFMNYLQKN